MTSFSLLLKTISTLSILSTHFLTLNSTFSKLYEWADSGPDIHSDLMYHFLKTSIFLCIFHLEFRWTYFLDNLVFCHFHISNEREKEGLVQSVPSLENFGVFVSVSCFREQLPAPFEL